MNGADFDALFDSFRHTAFRFEARAFYAVGGPESERMTAFRDGRPRPLRSVRTDRWLARMATSTILDGKTWSRVRVVDDPLSEYQRYQLSSYRESQAVGEEVRVTARTRATDAIGVDFWLLDGGTPHAIAVRMHYFDDGSVREREMVPAGTAELAQLHDQARALIDVAVALNEFLAAREPAANA